MLNRVVLIGRLARDPELRYSTTGTAICTFTLAVDGYGDREADFIPIVVWKKTAEAAANHLKKGHKAAVDGRIQTRNYENNEGRRIYVTEVIAESVKFLESANRDSGNREEQSGSNNGSRSNRNDPFADDDKPFDISDDDLPF